MARTFKRYLVGRPIGTEHAAEHPGYGTFIKVWVALLLLTFSLVGLSHVSQTYAVWGLLTLTDDLLNLLTD